jgi:hypothetical protein
MPTVNGTYYRSHGQGARAENEKAAAMKTESRSQDPAVEEGAKSDMTLIKHHDDGTHSAKHADGEIQNHVPMSEITGKLDEKHPDGGGPEWADDDQMDSDYGSEGSSQAIKTLLG